MGRRTDSVDTAAGANPNAARDHLANERTLLAWVRTCVAIMAFGFVVARFGLLLRELGLGSPRQALPGVSTAFGAGLVVCGAVLVVLATVGYLRAGRAIERNAYSWSPALVLLLSTGVVVVAIVLAVYLVVTA